MPAVPKLQSLNFKTRRERKQERVTAEEAAERECYRLVDLRDQGRCRVCGKRGSPTAASLLDRLHRHHLIYRSRGGKHETHCVLSVCPSCHDDIHVHGILRLAGDANVRDAVTGKFCGVQVSRYTTDTDWRVVGMC